jgi:ubiquinone/menaquinone biosynthesis C-methylase UbiE
MSHSVCPFWMGYLLSCPLRLFLQDPVKILAPYVTSGMTVLEVGPGMGFFTLPMARMVGPSGKVVCVDVQPKMRDALRRRAAKADLGDRIDARVCELTTLGISDLAKKVDFGLAFAVMHEIHDAQRLFGEIIQVMKPGARCLVAEPKFHVSARQFDETIATATKQGLQVPERPVISGSHAAVLSFTRGYPAKK